MPREAIAEKERRRVQSIEVGFRVLRVLRMAEGPLPLREIAARADMPPSKAHLYLVSFVREEVAYQEPGTGHYGLGAFAIQLGLAAVRQLDVVAQSAEAMHAVRDATGCAIALSLWGDRGPCVVAKADGHRQGAFTLRLGFIAPLTDSVTSLIFLAYLPRTKTRALLEGEPRDEIAKLEQRLERILADGHATMDLLENRTLGSVAAPVFAASGAIVAVLTLVGPLEYVVGNSDHCVALISDAGREVTRRLADKANSAGA